MRRVGRVHLVFQVCNLQLVALTADAGDALDEVRGWGRTWSDGGLGDGQKGTLGL